MIVSITFWEQVGEQLETIASDGDLSTFRQWPLVRSTFEWQSALVCNDINVANELAQQFAVATISNDRYRRLASDTMIGSPMPCPALSVQFPGQEVTLQSLHNAYILSRYETMLGSRLSDYDVVVEFGGGSGLFADTAHESGLWIIYDLPVMTQLQWYALDNVAKKFSIKKRQIFNFSTAPHQSYIDFDTCKSSIVLVSDLKLIPQVIDHWCKLCSLSSSTCLKAFVATMSISETQLNLRSAVEDVIEDFDAYLLLYQDVFTAHTANITNNHEYFNQQFRHRMELGASVSKYGKVRSHRGIDWHTSTLEPWFTAQQGKPIGANTQIRMLVGRRSTRSSFIVEVPCDDLLFNNEIIHLYEQVSQMAATIINSNIQVLRDSCKPASFRLGVPHTFYNVALPRAFTCHFIHLDANGVLVYPHLVTMSDCSAVPKSTLSSHAVSTLSNDTITSEDRSKSALLATNTLSQQRDTYDRCSSRSTLRIIGL